MAEDWRDKPSEAGTVISAHISPRRSRGTFCARLRGKKVRRKVDV